MSTKSEWECRKIWFFYFLIKLFVFPLPKSLEKLALFSNKLFPFSLCLALFSESFFLSFFLWCLASLQTRGKPQQRAVLCVDSAQYFFSRLWFGKVAPAASHTFHSSTSFESAPDRFETNLLSVSSASLFPLSMNLFCSCLAFPVFTGAQQNPKLLGVTQSARLWGGDEGKNSHTWQCAVPLIP